MDERTCKVQFSYVLTPMWYVRVVKFLEKVIIERNADLKHPFKCKRNPETFFREKSNVHWKDPTRQNPAQLIRTHLRQKRAIAWQKSIRK